MITTLTLNPCIDRTVTVDGFTYGGTNHVENFRCDVSGKGINVSIALNNIGEATRCLGFNYMDGGSLLTDFLNEEKISNDFLNVSGQLRTNIKIFDRKASVMSELNESGNFVNGDCIADLVKKVEEYLPETSLLVLDGSVPPGVSKDIYKILTDKAREYGVKTVIDAYGELLLEGIKASPYLIKPNKDELEEAFGEKIQSKEDAIRVARKIIAQGVTMVCVSMGKGGAMLITEDKAYFCAGAEIEVKGVQGAGDSLVAGMCYAIVHGLSCAEMLRYGVAVAHGSLTLEGTQMCTLESFQKMLPLIHTEEI
ncbi:1-phosphofructokinase [Caproiciproducens faecalis]|uniref:Tagatose-6-phosphate kinase n=1 Tax=Caproiciproducens faecalis TaxID=2820301 RepID=A0ABS7DP20_9FIRM|nr:1-phosphofructokinase [Caproiciproducens faecalis]MBW7573018.1 1-phosphofructokinase [Caproiciproducens faecalis]